VPAAAVIQRRPVLFIFIRFKGYLDGIENLSQKKIGFNMLEFHVGGRLSIG
jgi:hypothetical protein